MQHPLRWVLWACAFVVVAVAAAMGWPTPPGPVVRVTGLPWQVDVRADGSSQAMGLHLGADTLAQARVRTGDVLQVALVARLGEVGTLEALAEPFNAGPFSGRLVLSFDVPAATLQRWRDGAIGSEPMDGGVRRFRLRAQDLEEADRAALAGLSFVPTAKLTRDDIVQRFGAPQAQRELEGGAIWMSYPQVGVAATVAPGQRPVIEYVAPRDAARLSR